MKYTQKLFLKVNNDSLIPSSTSTVKQKFINLFYFLFLQFFYPRELKSQIEITTANSLFFAEIYNSLSYSAYSVNGTTLFDYACTYNFCNLGDSTNRSSLLIFNRKRSTTIHKKIRGSFFYI